MRFDTYVTVRSEQRFGVCAVQITASSYKVDAAFD